MQLNNVIFCLFRVAGLLLSIYFLIVVSGLSGTQKTLAFCRTLLMSQLLWLVQLQVFGTQRNVLLLVKGRVKALCKFYRDQPSLSIVPKLEDGSIQFALYTKLAFQIEKLRVLLIFNTTLLRTMCVSRIAKDMCQLSISNDTPRSGWRLTVEKWVILLDWRLWQKR